MKHTKFRLRRLRERRFVFRRQWLAESPISVSGVLVVATASTQDIYFHWLFDILPRLALLRHSPARSSFVYVSARRGYQIESLRRIGFPADQILDAHVHPVVRAESLCVPIHQVTRGREIPPWIVDFLRETFLPRDTSASPKRNLLISRATCKWRRVRNEQELSAALAPHGFELLHLERMSLEAQVCAFSCAKTIVAPHGSGLAGAVFAPPGCRIVELFPNDCYDLYYRLARAVGLDYTCTFDPTAPSGRLSPATFVASIPDVLRLARN